MFSTVDGGLTNLIHDCSSCILFTLSSMSSSACLFHAWKVSSRGEFCCCYYLLLSVEWLYLTGLQRHPYLGCSCLAGCVHSSVNKPAGANGRVSYDSLSHSRLCCRDREKK